MQLKQTMNLDNWQEYEAADGALLDKIALVTGAADGIGRALAISLAKAGATVLMLDKKSRHLEKLYDSICQRGYCEPVILPVDLMELDASIATQIALGIKSDFGRLDFLIHNAAELGSPSPLDHYDMDYWAQVMQINLQAPYLLTRAALPLLRQDQVTHVLFSSAEGGRKPKAYGGAYSIAYAGVEAQMTIWSQELEAVSKIRVNSIDPGPVRTSMRRRSHPGESQDSLATPQEVVRAYLQFLLSPAPTTGQHLTINR